AGRLGVRAQAAGALVLGAETLAHEGRPQAAGGAELRDFLQEVVVQVEEERQAPRELVDRDATLHARLDVGNAVGKREGELLNGRGSGLTDVVAADRDRMPTRRLLRAELDH